MLDFTELFCYNWTMNTLQRSPRTIFRITGLALAAFVVVSNGLVAAISLFARKDPALNSFLTDQPILYLVINYACIYGIGFLVYWLIIRRLPHSLPTDREYTFRELFQFFCIGYAFAICSNVIGTAITLISGSKTEISSSIADLVGNGGIAAGFIMIVVAPVIEELIFRKMIIDRTKRFGEKYAIVFSAVCFGLFHLNLQQFLYAASIGMVLGYVYSKTGKIQYTMIMHSIINAIGYLMALVASPVLESIEDISIDSLLGGGLSLPESLDISSLLLIIVAEQAIMAIIVMGIVFFIVKVRRIRFDYYSKDCLDKKNVFRTIYLNIGVILFVLLCVAGIVLSFMGGFMDMIG